MSVQRLKSLLLRAVRIQAKIEQERAHQGLSDLYLLRLKKTHLVIKDYLRRIIHKTSRQLVPVPVQTTGPRRWPRQ